MPGAISLSNRLSSDSFFNIMNKAKEKASFALFMMVRQVIYDCVCPVKLLYEEQAYHLVRECHL